ncbi:tetratricopeptide repeat protein [candidate division TA06 bacterium]|uniref:Tetratricopeptide repeat protein n=1 Tax=candidate division TA06 bacterium TaxID=2250710 RepID=A0A933IBQ2_UNCT6|nr:tetratricopeptide repeat protein [candidate division TA06 bacterium]
MLKKRILLLLIVLTLAAVPCHSQNEEEEAPEAAPAPVEAPAQASADSQAFYRLLDWPLLWQKSQASLTGDSAEQALDLADSAMAKAASLDIRLPLQAGYLKALSRQALRDRDRTLAYRYSLLALKADPTYPGLISSNFKIQQSRAGFSQALKDSWHNFNYAQKYFRHQLDFTAKALTLISIFLLASGLIFLLLLAVKHLPYLHHVLADLLPEAMPIYSRRLIAAALLVSLSLILGFISLALPVALMAIMATVYAARKEKALLLLAIVLLAGSGIGLGLGRQLFVNLNDDYLQDLSQANQSDRDAGLKARLAEYQQQRPDDLTPLFCLALMEKRAGNFNQARQYLDTLLAASGQNSKALNNLGNLLFYQGKIDSAAYLYRQAFQADPTAALPHYNLAQAYFKQVDFKAADQEREYAMSLARPEITAREGSKDAGLVLDELIPVSYFWGQVWLGLDPLAGFSPAESLSLTGLNLWLPAWLGLALLLLGLITVMVFFKDPAPAYCSVCNKDICPQCQAISPQQDLFCHECNQVISAATSPELQEKLIANLKLKKNRRKIWTGAVSNLLAPGSVLLLENMAALGLLLALLWGAIFAILCNLKLLLFPQDLQYFIFRTGPGWLILSLLVLSWLLTWVVFLKHANLLAAPSQPARKIA